MAFIRKIQEYLASALRAGNDDNAPPPRLADRERLLIWGANQDAVDFIKLLAAVDIPVAAIIDNDPQKIGNRLNDIPIVSPQKIHVFRNSVILIASRFHNVEIARQLHEMNYLYDIHFAEHPLVSGRESFVASFFDSPRDSSPRETKAVSYDAEEQRLRQSLEDQLYPLIPSTTEQGWIPVEKDTITAEDLTRPY